MTGEIIIIKGQPEQELRPPHQRLDHIREKRGEEKLTAKGVFTVAFLLLANRPPHLPSWKNFRDGVG